MSGQTYSTRVKEERRRIKAEAKRQKRLERRQAKKSEQSGSYEAKAKV